MKNGRAFALPFFTSAVQAISIANRYSSHAVCGA